MTTVQIGAVEAASTQLSPITRARAGAHAGALKPVEGPAVAVRFGRSAVSGLDAAVSTLDVWSDDRPSLQKLWWYAVYGQWTGERTPARVAGAGYNTVIVLPVTAALYLLAWMIERPSRFATVLALVTLAIFAGVIGSPL